MSASIWNPLAGASAGDFLFSATEAYLENTLGRAIQDRGVCVNDYPFNVKADGVTDDTLGWQTAINLVGQSGGGYVYSRNGRSILSQELFVLYENVTIKGSNRNGLTLAQKGLNKKIIRVQAKYCFISDIGFNYQGVPTTGAQAISFEYAGFGGLNNIWIQQAEVGIELNNSLALYLSHIDMRDYYSSGLQVVNSIDVHLSKFTFDCGNQTRGTLGGIRLVEKVEAFTAAQGDIINGVYSHTSDATVNTQRLRPSGNKFYSVYFDTSAKGIFLDKTVDTDYTDCWFSNSNESNIVIADSKLIRIKGGQCISARQNGIIVGAASKHVLIQGMYVGENSLGSPNTFDNILVQAGATDLKVLNNVIGDLAIYSNTGSQGTRYGVNVAVGASNRYNIDGNTFEGNLTSPILDGGTGLVKSISKNIGCTTAVRGYEQIAIGTSSKIVTHGLAFTPVQADILISPTVSLAACGVVDLWVSAATSTTFTVSCNVNATAILGFAWDAKVKGA